LSISYDEGIAPFKGLQRISAAMGYAYTHLPNNEIIKFRQSMDVFLDEILDMMNPKTIDLLVIKLYKEKMRKAIINAKEEKIGGE